MQKRYLENLAVSPVNLLAHRRPFVSTSANSSAAAADAMSPSVLLSPSLLVHNSFVGKLAGNVFRCFDFVEFIFRPLMQEGIGTDHRVFSDVIKGCASVSGIISGRALHGCVTKLRHMYCTEVSKSVLNMYAKCRRMDDCQKMFRQMHSVDPVVWNIVLTGLSDSCTHETMKFFREMHFADEPKPTSVTFAIVLPVCVRLGDPYKGKNLHSYIIKSGLAKDTLVGDALVSMYAKYELIFRPCE